MNKSLKNHIIVLLFLTTVITGYSQSVGYVALINTDNNEEVFQLTDEVDTIDLSITANINFRAKTDPEPLDGGAQCTFELTPTGRAMYSHTEGGAPYALFGDNAGNYNEWSNGFNNPPTKEIGEYTLVVKPGNGTSYTTKFYLKNGDIAPPSFDGYTIVLDAYADFNKFTGISGFEPAYKDNSRQCLAINASLYKDKWAAAQATFTGEDGTYDITLHTLCEYDGESSYVVKIDGIAVGDTFQNPRVSESEDFKLDSISFQDIEISKGALVQVEFNSHSNGLIPEGDAFAYSRGRWKDVSFTSKSKGSLIHEEQGGYLEIEAEDLEITESWTLGSVISGASGGEYIYWSGGQYFSNAFNGQIAVEIIINTPGIYQFIWKVAIANGTSTTEHNDTWLKVNADDFYGFRSATDSYVHPRPLCHSSSYKCPEGSSTDGFFKLFGGAINSFQWKAMTSDSDDHKIYVQFNEAKKYTFTIAARSSYHCIDVMKFTKVADISDDNEQTTNIDNTIDNEVAMFPNPAQKHLKLGNLSNISSVSIQNINGQVIHNEIPSENSSILDISNYSAGMYIVRFETKEGISFNEKLVIK